MSATVRLTMPRLALFHLGTITPQRALSTFLPFSLEKSGREKDKKPLYASVAPHTNAIYIHTPLPPSSYPKRLSTPLQRALQLRAVKWGGIVNFVWLGDSSPARFANDADPYIEPTVVSATAFSPRGRLEIPSLSLGNLDAVEAQLREHAQPGPVLPGTGDAVHLYVCTHGARDCRCGDMGGAVVRALREEVRKAGVEGRVRVGEVGHVGGHQFAANLLVYPHNEWLGLLTPSSVPALLARILSTPPAPLARDAPPLDVHHWRGRGGLGKEEQEAVYFRAA